MPIHLSYYRDIHLPLVLKGLIYRYKRLPIVYGIRCRATNMIYIGSTFDSWSRFLAHLNSGKASNLGLQESIAKYGLEWFTVYIFEVVNIEPTDDKLMRNAKLRKVEQKYIDMFPLSQLYNRIKSTKS